MDANENTEGKDAKSSPGWGRWKDEMKDNLMGFVFIAIWIAMGIPVIYFALMFWSAPPKVDKVRLRI